MIQQGHDGVGPTQRRVAQRGSACLHEVAHCDPHAVVQAVCLHGNVLQHMPVRLGKRVQQPRSLRKRTHANDNQCRRKEQTCTVLRD